MDKGNKVVMTQEGLKKLKKELDHLKTTERKTIASEIQKAMDFGDLSENAAYSAAIERRDLNESRIAEIEQMLENVEIFSSSLKKDGKIEIGSKVTLKFKGIESVWTVVGALEGDPGQRKIASDTPLGRALVGKKAGDTAQVELPTEAVTYEIISVN